MGAQYYYIDPDTQDTHGPRTLAEMQAMYDGKALTHRTMICRVVMEEWGPPEVYPEMLPQVAVAKPGAIIAPAPALDTEVGGRRRLHSVRALVVAAVVCALAVLAAGVFWQSHPMLRATLSGNAPAQPESPVTSQPPAIAPTPAAEPTRTPNGPAVGNVVRGTGLAIRLLEKYPKLKVAVISGLTFPKPDGIELYGVGAHGASISFLIPEEEWNGLSEGERLDLQAYVAAKVPWVREHAEDYMIIPKEAPVYAKNLDLARHLVDGAWRISSTKTYSDDPDGNLYLKTILVKGPGY